MPRLVYASSSSVYGLNKKQPFSESDRVDNPASLYASTKRVRPCSLTFLQHTKPLQQSRVTVTLSPLARSLIRRWLGWGGGGRHST
jgi:UDP-glucose 4-epimerase